MIRWKIAFRNQGKVATAPSGEVYYVSIHSPRPVVNRFSATGQLLGEFEVAGATIDLQSGVASKYLKDRGHSSISGIGGYTVINALAVDTETGNVWLAINGSSDPKVLRPEAFTVYEYSPEGKKLAEYAVRDPVSPDILRTMTGITDIDVCFPVLFVISSPGKAYRYDLTDRKEVTPVRTKVDDRGDAK